MAASGVRLDELSFAHVLTTPLWNPADDESPLRRAIVAGLMDAAGQDRAVATMWCRRAPGEPLTVLVAGSVTPVADDGACGTVPLLFPLGATGVVLMPDQVKSLIAEFDSWVPCAGAMDPLLADRAGERSGHLDWSSSPFDDVVAYMAHRAFAWLVVCTPASPSSVRTTLDHLRRTMAHLRQAGSRSEADTIELERSAGVFRELSRAGVHGVWEVAALVGTRGSDLPLPSVLCSAAERSAGTYRLRPVSDHAAASPDQILEGQGIESDDGRHPFLATHEFVATLVRPPEVELPGVRVVRPPLFDTTFERRGMSGPTVAIGEVLDRHLRPAGRLDVPLDTINRHTFVCGATGAGKSQTVRGLLEALSAPPLSLPWLVIEPAKAEYARMAGRLAGVADVLVIRPGDPDAAPACLNPLEPASLDPGNSERTFPLQSHADLVRALFMAAFQAEEPFPQVLSRALTDCYEAAGWDLVTGEPMVTWDGASGQPVASAGPRALPRLPVLADLQRVARQVVGEIGYDREITQRVRGFVDVRIGSLRLGVTGRFFEGGHPLDVAALLRRNVVFELESVTSDQDKAFLMGVVLIRLYEQLLLEERERFAEQRTSPAPLRHVTVIEEAHRLLRNVPADSPIAHALELFASLLAEVRAYGEGVVIAEQIPSKLLPDAIKNTAFKVVHRLPAADDRFAVGATMNLTDEQSEYVVSLTPGVGAVFMDGMDRPVLVSVREGEQRESAEVATRAPPLAGDGRRSCACGPACRERPCTLREMRRAQQLLARHAELALWAEVSLAAHLTDRSSPRFVGGPAMDELADGDRRLTECAIAHAIEDALAPRRRLLQADFDPDALGRHLAVAARYALGFDQIDPCDGDRGEWQGGLRRFTDIARELERMPADGARAEAVRRAAADRGVELHGASSADQLAYLQSLPWARVSEEQQFKLLSGVNTLEERSRIQELIAALAPSRSGEDDSQRATRAWQTLTWENPDDPKALVRMLIPVASTTSTKEGDDRGN